MSVLLVTFLSCSQVQVIADRLQNIALLTLEQKKEIIQELKKVVPSCPVIIKNK
jgi:hypothetical protein